MSPNYHRRKVAKTVVIFITTISVALIHPISGAESKSSGNNKVWKALDKKLDAVMDMKDSAVQAKVDSERLKEVSTPVFELQKKTKHFVESIKQQNERILKNLVGGKDQLDVVKKVEAAYKKRKEAKSKPKTKPIATPKPEKSAKKSTQKKQIHEPVKVQKHAQRVKSVEKSHSSTSYTSSSFSRVNNRKPKVEKIKINDVVIHEKMRVPGKPLRNILINKLVVLNSENDDPDKRTVFIEKAIIDPSVYRDKTIDRLKMVLFGRKGKKFNSELDRLTAELKNLHFDEAQKTQKKPKSEKSKIPKKENFKTELTKIKQLLSSARIPTLLPRDFRASGIAKEMKHFDSEMKKEMNSVDNLAVKEPILGTLMTKIRSALANLKKAKKGLKKVKSGSKSKSKIAKQIGMMEKVIKELKGGVEAGKDLEKKVKEKVAGHRKRVGRLLKKHRERVVEVTKVDNEVIGKLEKDIKAGKGSKKKGKLVD